MKSIVKCSSSSAESDCSIVNVFFLALLFSVFNSAAQVISVAQTKQIASAAMSSTQPVYVCLGASAYAYHSQSGCAGLGNCQSEIVAVDSYQAAYTMNRVPCCRCWSNVGGRCKDDYVSSGGSGADADVLMVMAVLMVVTGAAVVSNDFYLYQTNSRYFTKNNFDPSSGISSISDVSGLSFGFRRKFTHSALEYGASVLQSQVSYNDGNGGFYTEDKERWGGHFNFIQHIFYNRTPDWLRVYVGPTLNHVYALGLGGIVGSEARLSDRLKVDVRYERSGETNQFQFGLIYTYQKKFFWQR